MSETGLLPRELDVLVGVFRRHRGLERVLLFGSRAKGTPRSESDVDLAIAGALDDLGVEALAFELDELPLPYRFDVKSLDAIRNPALLDHIRRVGVTIYEREAGTR